MEENSPFSGHHQSQVIMPWTNFVIKEKLQDDMLQADFSSQSFLSRLSSSTKVTQIFLNVKP